VSWQICSYHKGVQLYQCSLVCYNKNQNRKLVEWKSQLNQAKVEMGQFSKLAQKINAMYTIIFFVIFPWSHDLENVTPWSVWQVYAEHLAHLEYTPLSLMEISERKWLTLPHIPRPNAFTTNTLLVQAEQWLTNKLFWNVQLWS